MLALQLPNKTLDSLDKIMRKFWWGDGVDKKKLHTMRWNELCKPIKEWDLGIRKSKDNNMALPAKTAWRRRTNENLLRTKIIKVNCPKKSL